MKGGFANQWIHRLCVCSLAFLLRLVEGGLVMENGYIPKIYTNIMETSVIYFQEDMIFVDEWIFET